MVATPSDPTGSGVGAGADAPSCGLNAAIRTTPGSSPTEILAAVIRATLLMIREAVAKIRVGFIDCSDRAVQRMCAGCAGSDGYSYRSAVQTCSVELKCEGCTDRSGFDTSAESTGRHAQGGFLKHQPAVSPGSGRKAVSSAETWAG